jgi:hypothetical protein
MTAEEQKELQELIRRWERPILLGFADDNYASGMEVGRAACAESLQEFLDAHEVNDAAN